MTGKVRIIGGAWRGRKLEVLPLPGLRPSGDRSRETLFNWLGPSVQGCVCLDLFAGTVALGLEAVSRGARSAILVERSARVLERIREQIEGWPGRERVELVNADALQWLPRQREPFDLVFIDPPHGMGLQIAALELLVEHGLVSPQGRVCVESGLRESWAGEDASWLDRHLIRLRSGRFGQVELGLYRPATL
jgi:16S rRNA (guanine966-N2)-methyltransferase